MDWVKWIVPLIALVVWILVNLLKMPDDKKPKQGGPKVPRPPGQNPWAAAPRQQKTDLERFIEEARQRRQQPGQRQEVPPAANPAPPPKERTRETALPRVQPNYSRTPLRAPTQPVPALPVARPVPSRQPEPDRRQREPEPIIATEVVSASPRPLALSDGGAPMPSLGAYSLRERVSLTSGSDMAREVTQMLTNPNSVRTAFVLREILDRPIALRRGRR